MTLSSRASGRRCSSTQGTPPSAGPGGRQVGRGADTHLALAVVAQLARSSGCRAAGRVGTAASAAKPIGMRCAGHAAVHKSASPAPGAGTPAPPAAGATGKRAASVPATPRARSRIRWSRPHCRQARPVLGIGVGCAQVRSAARPAGLSASGSSTTTRKPMACAACTNMRPSWPPPSTPRCGTLPGDARRVVQRHPARSCQVLRHGARGFGLALPEVIQPLVASSGFSQPAWPPQTAPHWPPRPARWQRWRRECPWASGRSNRANPAR
jgi:hypothetical protein